MSERGFVSDNASGVHPAVLAAIERANVGHATAYGADPWTERAVERLREAFARPSAEVLLTFGGTGANVVALAALVRPFQSVLCARSAHLWRDECAAPERFLGAKLVPLEDAGGKLTPDAVERGLERTEGVHHAQPRVVSIAQATEWGTVYTPDETRALAELAHARALVLHVDGARLANAAARLGTSLAALTSEAGVDVVSFGGTKNGLLAGEAVLFLEPALAAEAPFHRKQAAQLPSKMRFVAAQLEALLEGELWRANAERANAMARLLAERARELPGVEIVQPVETNAVFARLPARCVAALRERVPFALWDERRSIARWMTSFDTTEEDVARLIAAARDVLAR